MTWVDLVVLAVLAVSALFAFMRGLVREVLGLAAWVGAIFAGVWALPRVRPQFQEWLGTSPWIDPVAFAVVFILCLIVLLLISRWISALVRASPIGGLDRTLGLVFGLARGAALIIIAYILGGLVQHVEQWPKSCWRLAPFILPTAERSGRWSACRRRVFHPPPVYPPPPGRQTTADALLHATPQGRAVGR